MAVADTSEPWPVPAARCPCCHLVIGTARATDEPRGEAGERAHASAAGVMRGIAARADGKVLDHDVILAALGRVAVDEGCPSIGRLRMLDYAKHAEADKDLPPIADVIATFGGWKAATRGDEAAAYKLERAA